MPTPPARPKRWAWLRRGLLTLLVLYLVLCGVMLVAQGSLLFHPSSIDNARSQALASQADVEPLEIEADSVVLRGFLVRGRAEGRRPTVIYFGGNAESVWQRANDQRWVVDQGWNLVLMSYRGYDRSSGSPGADVLLSDAIAIHDAMVIRPDVDPELVVGWGVSLGSGVAAHLARQRTLSGVILSAPYARLSDVAADLYPWLPVRWLFLHEIDTLGRAPDITEPVLLLHGEADTLIPIDHSQRLADAWGGETRLIAIPDTGHNGLFGHATVRGEVLKFLAERLP